MHNREKSGNLISKMFGNGFTYCLMKNMEDPGSAVTATVVFNNTTIINTVTHTNQNQNGGHTMSSQKMLVHGILYAFVMTTNIMLINVFVRKCRPFTITTKIFIYLSIIDILHINGTILNHLTTDFLIGNESFCVYLAVTMSLNQFTFLTDILLFVIISFFRNLTIRKPMLQISGSQVNRVLLVTIIFCFLYGVGNFLHYLNMTLFSVIVSYIIVLAIFTLILLTLLVVNVALHFHLKKSTIGTSRSIQDKREAGKTLIIITLFYWTCFLPFIVITSFRMIGIGDKNVMLFMQDVLVLLMMCNSGLNSLIMIIRTKRLRHFYTGWFSLC